MNNMFFNINEVGIRYMDPIIEQLTYSILRKLEVMDFFHDSVYIDDNRRAISQPEDTQGNTRIGDRRVDVEINSHLNPDSGQLWDMNTPYNTIGSGTCARWYQYYEKIWCDPEVSVALIEHTVPFTVDLNFTLRFKGYEEAQVCLDKVLSYAFRNIAQDTHDITYSYPLSRPLLSVLDAIYQNRKSENQKYSRFEYLQRYACAEFVQEVNKYDLVRNETIPSAIYIKKYQLRCIGKMTSDMEKPEVVLEDKLPHFYLVRFMYQFQAGRPRTLQLYLPPVIEQTPLPKILFQKESIGWFPKLQSAMQNLTYTEMLNSLDKEFSNSMSTYRFPEYDKWNMPADDILVKNDYHQLFIGIVLIDEGSTQGSVNFYEDLDTLTLHPKILEIMSQHTQQEMLGLGGLFNISVFIDSVKLDPSLVQFNPQTLTVTFLADRPTYIYRVVLSEAMNIKWVSRKFFDIIIENRYFFPMTIFKNLNYLCQVGEYCVTPEPRCVTLFKNLQKRGLLSQYLLRLIGGGYASGLLLQFTQTMHQLVDYLSNTQAKFNVNETLESQRISSSLYTVMMDMLVADGIITEDLVPQQYLRLPKGWPYGPGAGGWENFNTPLRIQDTTFLLNNS